MDCMAPQISCVYKNINCEPEEQPALTRKFGVMLTRFTRLQWREYMPSGMEGWMPAGVAFPLVFIMIFRPTLQNLVQISVVELLGPASIILPGDGLVLLASTVPMIRQAGAAYGPNCFLFYTQRTIGFFWEISTWPSAPETKWKENGSL